MGHDSLAALQGEFPGVDHTRVADLLSDSVEGVGGDRAEEFARERLRALTREDDDAPGVLFLCVHNSGRSQMAAAWLSRLGGEGVRVYSGGSAPGDAINRAAVEAMDEVGIDIRQQFPKPWSDEVLQAVDVVITMGCGDECPYYAGTRYADWDVDDPAGRGVHFVRLIRDDIEHRVRGLLQKLGVAAAA